MNASSVSSELGFMNRITIIISKCLSPENQIPANSSRTIHDSFINVKTHHVFCSPLSPPCYLTYGQGHANTDNGSNADDQSDDLCNGHYHGCFYSLDIHFYQGWGGGGVA